MIYNNIPILGPTLPPDRDLIGAICNLTDPKVIVEFGYFAGDATKAMFENVDDDCMIVSYDIKDRGFYSLNKNHIVLLKDMKDFVPHDVDNRCVDIVFFDASHILEDSEVAFEKIKPLLHKHSIIIVHDTGVYDKDKFNPPQLDYIKNVKAKWVYHCPDEHQFILNRKKEGWNVVNLFARTKIRHGIAILQKEFKV